MGRVIYEKLQLKLVEIFGGRSLYSYGRRTRVREIAIGPDVYAIVTSNAEITFSPQHSFTTDCPAGTVQAGRFVDGA